MSRINIPSLDDAPIASRPTLEAIRKQLGVVPNIFRLAGNSPVALAALTGLQGTLAKTFDVKTRERIALAVAEVNGCDYCLSAHTYIGLNMAKIGPEEIALNRQGASSDPAANAAVAFAAKVARARGRVSDADLAEVRAAGFADAQIVEVIALVAENVFTNFLNEAAQTDIDFPVVRRGEAA
ncbi:carboxymuconolactone decarboxylase family protein [Luteibacter sp. 329MFSha]|uniref:carboxymuconolactone decarboxylase family protein n=1 Tax=Luteibacter sp. 329MFSha TaxID=1798239 RepID=UPI0008C3B10F|nr:carboxymuconolactone decarboxylase family protein [Luteibacter sp. 329MFSha]SEV87255.1 uncharacterized peroxidase-related enzyme [Luteibacter sp. 329MFSha]